jgi:hypothetical protein
MCFSPIASFGASVVLTATGVAALTNSRTLPQRALSGVPFLFALQQFAEGILWLSLTDPRWSECQNAATYSFLIFAQVIWPAYVPLCILLFERNERRKKLVSVLTIAGFLFSLYAAFALYSYPVSAEVAEHHIKYHLEFELSQKWYYGLLYFVPTILAPLASSVKRLRWLGYLFLGSYIVARLLFHFWVISVWCFFGAIISLLVVYLVRETRNQNASSNT